MVILLQIAPSLLFVEISLDLHHALIIIASDNLIDFVVGHVPATLISFLRGDNVKVTISDILKQKFAEADRHEIFQCVLCIL